MRYFTSDLHFYHKKIGEFCPSRPRDLVAMHSLIIASWNYTVRSGDTVYVLGDFSFGNSKETKALVRQLNGRKVLVMGNHDRRSEKWYNDAGFMAVTKGCTIKIENFFVQLSHYPFKLGLLQRLYYGIMDKGYTRYQDRKIRNVGQYLLHGHCHAKYYKQQGCAVDVGWDSWHRLLSERDVASMLRRTR